MRWVSLVPAILHLGSPYKRDMLMANVLTSGDVICIAHLDSHLVRWFPLAPAIGPLRVFSLAIAVLLVFLNRSPSHPYHVLRRGCQDVRRLVTSSGCCHIDAVPDAWGGVKRSKGCVRFSPVQGRLVLAPVVVIV